MSMANRTHMKWTWQVVLLAALLAVAWLVPVQAQEYYQKRVGSLSYVDTPTTTSWLPAGVAGSYLRSGGLDNAPLWSTLALPATATVNRLVYATAANTWGESANLTYDGTSFAVGTVGPHGIGGATNTRYQLDLTGSFTAVGATLGAGLNVSTALTNASGVNLAGVNIAPTLTNVAGTTAVAAFLQVDASALTITAGSVTDAATVRIVDAPTGATNNYALWVNGVTRFDSAMRFSSVAGGPSIEGPSTVLRFTSGTTAYIWDNQAGTTELMRLSNAGLFTLGDTTNANMVVGLTLNQGANDDQILALKSSDVATGLTTGTVGQDVETDDFLTISKADATTGVVMLQTLAESGASYSLFIEGYSGAPSTADTSTSLGATNFFVGQHDGSNALVDMPVNSDAFAWGEIDSAGARQTRMILKADDGELHLGNTTLVVLQDHDDDALVTDFERFRTERQGLPTLAAADAGGVYTRLRDLGLVGTVTAEEWAQGVRPLMSVQRLTQLLAGTTRQVHAVADLLLDDLMARRSLTPQEKARIPAGIRQRKGIQ